MIAEKEIWLLYNPLSEKAKKIATDIAAILNDKAISNKLIGDWPNELVNCTAVWIVGGDGTLNYFINKYPMCNIPLSIFKGGTGNDFSWKLYGNITIAEQIEQCLQENARYVDAATCNDKLYINSLGIGFDGEVLKSMKSVRRLGGHLGYLFIVIKKIFSFKEFEFAIHANNETKQGKYLIVMINNNTRTGGGFMVTPLAKIDDGKLDLLMCQKLSVLQRFKTLPLIEKGKHLSKSYITTSQVEQIHVSVHKTALASLDGELIEGNEFEIKVLPKKFLFSY